MAIPKIEVEELKREVRIALSENENVSPLLVDDGSMDDRLQLGRDALIDSLITKAIDKVNTLAPIAMVACLAEELNDAEWMFDDKYCDYTNLPNDFLRFVSAKYDNWDKPVYNPIDQDSELYQWQRSDFASIRASKKRPVVAIVPDNFNGGLRAELFPKDEDADSPSFKYIKQAVIEHDEEEGLDIVAMSPTCKNAVVYTIASLYYITINEPEMGQRMAAEAAEEMGLTSK